MKTHNRADLLGNVTADPMFAEVGTAGTPMCKFTVATNRTDELDAAGEYHRCVAFARLAVQIHASVRKGDPVYVSGRLEYDPSGRMELIVRECSFLKAGPR